MYLIVYDIEKDRLRTRFAKFLKRFGVRLQFSVFEIENSPRILENVKTEIKTVFEEEFGEGDSVLIFKIPDDACIAKFGHPVHETGDLVIG